MLISTTMAATLGEEILNASPLASARVAIKVAAMEHLVTMGYLVDHRGEHAQQARVERTEVEAFFSRVVTLTGCGMEVLRVSALPLTESAPGVTMPDGSDRRWAGVDPLGRQGVSAAELTAAVGGVWPLSETSASEASAARLPFLVSVAGFVPAPLAATVVGYRLNLGSAGRRWIYTCPLGQDMRERLFPNGAVGGWISVPQGPPARIETL